MNTVTVSDKVNLIPSELCTSDRTTTDFGSGLFMVGGQLQCRLCSAAALVVLLWSWVMCPVWVRGLSPLAST